MEINNILVISILITLNIVCVLVGFLFGKIINNNGVSVIKTNTTKNAYQQEKVFIDDKKVVVDISTKGLEKKYESIGDKKQTQENISSAIDKLKNMKG